MKRLVLRPLAQNDIDEIWRFTDRSWGEEQADSYVAAIETAMLRLADTQPGSMRCDSIHPGYLRCRAGSHFVFGFAKGEDLVVVRVLHERMNFGSYLNESSND